MNKYQLNFLKQIIVSVDGSDGAGGYELDNEGNLVIIQNENYNITSYTLKIKIYLLLFITLMTGTH